jgi:hypothetical protein
MGWGGVRRREVHNMIILPESCLRNAKIFIIIINYETCRFYKGWSILR